MKIGIIENLLSVYRFQYNVGGYRDHLKSLYVRVRVVRRRAPARLTRRKSVGSEKHPTTLLRYKQS